MLSYLLAALERDVSKRQALDLRGLLDALRLIRRGVGASRALDMGITNKAFDAYEHSLIREMCIRDSPPPHLPPRRRGGDRRVG